MDTILVLILVVVAAVVLGGIAFIANRGEKSKRLQQQFGPEYDRTLRHASSKSEAEKDLEDRAARVETLNIQALGAAEKQKYSEEWRAVQAHFVDDPSAAITEADTLVQQVMNARGYPITDFERQARDISVEHSSVVSEYRAGHAIAESHRNEPVSTEDLRQAMIHYRVLFAELLGTSPVHA